MKLEGHFDRQLSPRIDLTMGGNLISCVVDTGFNGELMLPRDLVNALGLEFSMVVKAELADGSIIDTSVYSGNINWFGNDREIEAMVSDGSESLLETEMLRGVTLLLNLDSNIVEISNN